MEKMQRTITFLVNTASTLFALAFLLAILIAVGALVQVTASGMFLNWGFSEEMSNIIGWGLAVGLVCYFIVSDPVIFMPGGIGIRRRRE
ncbi:hypothetical protein [Thioalkalivibrio thiocyanodenitrificans]|uniref:hypothetical protein n=1 Tax=Thioalkalivibrio thiocyanodenitrificans TaxID=243063 RepID=UPI00036E200B|nr:hypothetical protein [Thioalkalivibrio thiocyanodenitrificans]